MTKLSRQGTAGTKTLGSPNGRIHAPLQPLRFRNDDGSTVSIAPSVTPGQNPLPLGGIESSNRELFPSSLQRHGSTSTQDSMFEANGTTSKKEQVRLALVNLNRVSQDQKRVLNDTFYEIMAKFDELKATNEKFVKLNKSGNEQLTAFKEISGRSEQEYETQVQNLQELHEEGRKIEDLQGSLQAEKEKVEAYRAKMEAVRQSVLKQQDKEAIWRERASKRLRILWTVISLSMMTWFIFASLHLFYRHEKAALNWTDETVDVAERAKRLLRVIDKEL